MSTTLPDSLNEQSNLDHASTSPNHVILDAAIPTSKKMPPDPLHDALPAKQHGKFRADLPIFLRKSTMLTSASPLFGEGTPDRRPEMLSESGKTPDRTPEMAMPRL